MAIKKSCLTCDYFHEDIKEDGSELKYCSANSLGDISPITIPNRLLAEYFCYYYCNDTYHKEVQPLFERKLGD